MRVNADILNFFKGDNPKGYQTRIHAVLEDFVKKHTQRHLGKKHSWNDLFLSTHKRVEATKEDKKVLRLQYENDTEQAIPTNIKLVFLEYPWKNKRRRIATSPLNIG